MELVQIDNLVVSSRVRLARNIEGVPFKTKVRGAFADIAATVLSKNRNFLSKNVAELQPEMAQALFEQHIISRELLQNKINSVIVTRSDNKVVVMLGEEDHVRIQSIQTGFDLQTAFSSSKKIADDISSAHKIARRDDFGYLTSCPTNLGVAMRASVMMFLPALTQTGNIAGIARQLSNQHITIRGTNGEGSEAGGYMYQISNQCCIGMTEKQIIEMVQSVTMQIAKLETRAQIDTFRKNGDEVMDSVMRAWGILTNAYMISSVEAVENLALLKLGSNLGILKFKNHRVLDELFFIIQPQTLVTVDNRATAITERDKIRAKKVGDILRSARL
jgi:protein arginine kinase